MSKQEKGITLYRNGEGIPVAMKIRPEKFTRPELIIFAASRIFTSSDRQCIAVMATGRTIFSEEYIRDVRDLEPDARRRHIMGTAIYMSKAITVFIQEKASR